MQVSSFGILYQVEFDKELFMMHKLSAFYLIFHDYKSLAAYHSNNLKSKKSIIGEQFVA